MYRILIVNPPVSVHSPRTAIMPLPCLVLGGILRDLPGVGHSFEYGLIDLDLLLKRGCMNDDAGFYGEAAALLLEERPDVCLFSTHGVNVKVAIQLCREIKETAPGVFTVLGGVAATLQAREIVEHFEEVDMVVKGEAETALPELVAQLVGDGNLGAVPSAVVRHRGSIVENPRCHVGRDEALAVPDYSLIDMDAYRAHNESFPYLFPGFALVESGRGCRFNCSFCAPAKMWGRQVRYRPIDSIIEEMVFLKERGFDFTFFTQDNLDAGFMLDLASELTGRGVDIPWGGYARINGIDDEALDTIAASGCRILFVGLETPNRKSQKYIRKVIEESAVVGQVKRFNARGIKLICSFIAGFDGETEEELERTLELALECSASEDLETLRSDLAGRAFGELPGAAVNFCLVHPLAYMPGTDFSGAVGERLRLAGYTHHHDAYGSTIFGLDTFTKRHWRHVFNSFVTHLDDERVSFYYPRLRLFNFLNARPFHLVWFLERRGVPLLDLLGHLTGAIGVETVMSTSMQELEKILTGFFAKAVGAPVDIQPERVVRPVGAGAAREEAEEALVS